MNRKKWISAILILALAITSLPNGLAFAWDKKSAEVPNNGVVANVGTEGSVEKGENALKEAKTALENLPAVSDIPPEFSDGNDVLLEDLQRHVEEARELVDYALSFDGVEDDDLGNLWRLQDIEIEIVDRLIKAIPKISDMDFSSKGAMEKARAAIERARAAYEKLKESQKDKISLEVLELLVKAEEYIKKAEELFAKVNADIVVDWNDIRQEIDGFGVTQDEECTYAMQEPQRSEVMDLLYSQEDGIGLSILRTEIGCDDVSKPSIEPEEGVYNYEPDIRELWYFNEAQARGVEKIFGTAWSPPAWMKTNGKLERGGFLKKAYYQKYADFLAKYVEIYRDYHGVDIYGISPANEPDYPAPWKSCVWTPSMMEDFVGNYLKPTFEREGLDTKIIVGEMGVAWTERVAVPALQNPTACPGIDIVAGHYYRGPIRPFSVANEKGKKVWMTETSDVSKSFTTDMEDGLAWAKRIHKFLTVPEVSAFCYWRGSHTVDDNQTLIHINSDNASYITSKRLFALGHYSKFIRPGYVRIGSTDNPLSKVYISAYKDESTDDFVIVAVNDSKDDKVLDIVPEGFTVEKLDSYVTNDQVDMEQRTDMAIVEDNITVSLEGKSITTFVGRGMTAD